MKKVVSLVRRAGRVTRERCGHVLALVVLGGGCREPAGSTASKESSTSGGSGTVTGSSGTVPDRVPPEPFVLPEGCGDGVPVSGQYDCHYPVSLEYLMDAMEAKQDPTKFFAWDMDADGGDELVAQAPGFSPIPMLLAPLRWNGESFDVGKPAEARTTILDWTSHFDINKDGRHDLVKFSAPRVFAQHLAGPNFGLEDEEIPAVFDVDILGRVGVMDTDEDGRLEALAVRWPYTAENPFPLLEFWLHRNNDGNRSRLIA